MWGSFAKAVFKGEHKLSPLTILGVVFAAVYTIVPIDLIPDVPIIGWIDDLGFWGVVLGIFRWELGRFEARLRAKSVTTSAAPKP